MDEFNILPIYRKGMGRNIKWYRYHCSCILQKLPKIKNERLYKKSQANRKRFGEISELSKSIHFISWFLTLRLNNHD